MAKIVQIEADPGFKPKNPAETEAFEAAKKQGRLSVPYPTAMENLRNSKGLYRLAAVAEAEQAVSDVRPLSSRTLDELKLILLTLGLKPEPGSKKADIVALIQSHMDKMDIADD